MYDLNVLTVSGGEIIAQLDHLKNQSLNGVPVHYIEFGNEFFIESHYSGWFADAIEYMEFIAEGLAYARQVLPHAKLGVPAGYNFCGDTLFEQWNVLLADYLHLFDAFTIHEYTACTKSVDTNEYRLEDRRSALAAWGEVEMQLQIEWLDQFFPRNRSSPKEIWMTEWSYAIWSGIPLQDEANWDPDTIVNSGISGIYKAGFLLASIGRSQSATLPHTTTEQHLFSSGGEKEWHQCS